MKSILNIAKDLIKQYKNDDSATDLVANAQRIIDEAPLTAAQISRKVKRMIKIDDLIQAEYEKEEKIEMTANYWNGFYSGYEPTPTSKCEQLLGWIKSKVSKLSNEHTELMLSVTMQEASNGGYCVDGADPEEFKQAKGV